MNEINRFPAMFDKALEGLIVKQGGQSMNLENCISFCRTTTRRLGGHIISIQSKRQNTKQRWLSSFTALSFTFFSAFPGLPSQVAVAPEAPREIHEEQSIDQNLSLEDLCQLKKSVQEIQSQTETVPSKEEELCLEKKTKDELLTEIVGENTHKGEVSSLEATIASLTKGFPIEVMAKPMAGYDRNIAALIVGIAKKESNWGKASPSKSGVDCYNYWGYKGAGGRGQAMGYACFASPEEAVQAVGDRLERLVEKRATSEPSNLVTTWKCGNSCASHSKESVQSWINDVHQYYSKIAMR